MSRVDAPSAVGYSVTVTVRSLQPATCAVRRRARPARAAAAGSAAGSRRSVIGCRAVGTARSPSPTSTTGSSPNCSAIANPPSIVLIGPHGTPASTSRSNHSSAPRVASRSTRSGRSSSRLRGAVGVAGEPRVVGDLGDAEHLAQLAELPVVGGGDDQVAVRGRQRLVGEDAGVRVAHPVGHHAARDVGGAVVDQPGQRRGQQVHLDVLALPRSRPGGAARRGCRSRRGCRPSRRRPRSRPGTAARPGRRSGSSARRSPAPSGRSPARSRPAPEPNPLIDA